jgi:hypothetical protein
MNVKTGVDEAQARRLDFRDWGRRDQVKLE